MQSGIPKPRLNKTHILNQNTCSIVQQAWRWGRQQWKRFGFWLISKSQSSATARRAGNCRNFCQISSESKVVVSLNLARSRGRFNCAPTTRWEGFTWNLATQGRLLSFSERNMHERVPPAKTWSILIHFAQWRKTSPLHLFTLEL